MLEDIDSLFGKDRASKNGKSALSFSGLLNALDGVGAASGQVASPRTGPRAHRPPAGATRSPSRAPQIAGVMRQEARRASDSHPVARSRPPTRPRRARLRDELRRSAVCPPGARFGTAPGKVRIPPTSPQRLLPSNCPRRATAVGGPARFASQRRPARHARRMC